MITKQQIHCREKGALVVVLLETRTHGRGRYAATTLTPISCTQKLECPGTAFCRFVNPLTTQVPLEIPECASAST
jgi:hypothetical protein